MSAPHVSAVEIIDPHAPTWAEFVRLSPEDERVMNSIMTPAGLRNMLASEQTFVGLLAACGQIFSATPVYTLTPQGFQELRGGAARARYAPHFAEMQQWVLRNHEIRAEYAASGHSRPADFFNLSFAFPGGAEGFVGYVTYLRYTSVELLGDEHVFLFYHQGRRKAVLAVIPSIEQRSAGVAFMCAHGLVNAFDKVCAWCGHVGGLVKCPCRRVRYCGADCQRRHWELHKVLCPCRRGGSA